MNSVRLSLWAGWFCVVRGLALAALLWALPVHAEEGRQRVEGLAVLVDADGSESIDSVSQPARAADFKAAPYGFSAGYTRKVHWLRFTLQAPPVASDGERQLLLEIHPPYLDDLRLYIPRQAVAGFNTYQHGDLRPFGERAYRHRTFIQQVEFPDDKPMVVYARLQTTSSSVLSITVHSPNRFIEATTSEYALLGMFFGLLIASLLANLRHVRHGDPLHRAFLFHLATTLCMLLGINGLVAEYVAPTLPLLAHHWTSIGVIMVTVSGTFFYRKALEIEHAARWMQHVYRAVFWLALLLLPSSLLDLYPEAANVLMPAVLLLLLTGSVRSIQLWRQDVQGSKLLLAAHVFSLLGAFSAAFTLLGWLPGQFWLIYGFMLGTLGTLTALQVLFILRARSIESDLIEARLAAERAEGVAAADREARDGQRRFLAMLTHELKTPLSVIRLTLGTVDGSSRMQQHAEHAVDEIDAIITRCDLVSRFDDGRLAVTPVPCSLREVLAELVTRHPEQTRIHLYLPERGDLPLHTDPILLRMVLENLLGNALKYAPAAAEVCVEVSEASRLGKPGFSVRVENPVGPAGRPDPARVFEKYYRAAGAHGRSGSGLGLYIVHGLCRMLGWDIQYLPYQTDVVFELWLPS